MTLLPIVQRELRVGARQVWPRWGRVGAVMLGTVLCFQFISVFIPGRGSVSGQAVFGALTWTAFLLALCMFAVTGDCLSRERREGTLGLLFLTDLKGYDVVLGKLAGGGLMVLYALAAFAPLFMLPVLLGGVTWAEMIRVTFAILNVAFVAIAVGIWRSVRTASGFVAMRSAAFWYASLMGLPWVVSWFLPWPLGIVAVLSPGAAFTLSDEANYGVFSWYYFVSLLVGLLEALGMIALAGHALRRNWREEMRSRSLTNQVLARRERWRQRRLGRAAVKLSPLYRSFAPVAVAVLRIPGLRLAAWAGGCLGLLGGFMSAVSGIGHYVSIHGLYVALQLITMGLFAWMAGRFLCEARRNGELELLLTTTGGATGIVRDQWFAIVRLLRGPMILIGLGTVPTALASLAVGTSIGNAELAGLIAGVLQMANAILGVFAICWVAMWRGLFARRPAQVIFWSIGLVNCLPMLVGLGVTLILQAWVNSIGWGQSSVVWLLLVPMPMLGLVKNLFFIWWANRQLCAELRVPKVRWFASQRVAPSAGHETKPEEVPAATG